METVNITQTVDVEVTVYKVEDQDYNEYSFEVDVDSDGELIITIDNEVILNEDSVREWLCEDNNLSEVIYNACSSYSEKALSMLVDQDEGLEWLVNNLHPLQKERLLGLLSEDEE